MARVPYVEKAQAPLEVAETFAKMEARGNPVVNLWKMAAHSPSTLLHFIRMGNALRFRTKLDPKLREMAILLTAERLGCEYERSAHARLAKESGVTDEQIAAISAFKTSTAFNQAERDVLRFALEVGQKAKVSDKTFADCAKRLDADTMVELALTVGFYEMVARILLPFEVDLEAGTAAS